MNLCRSLPLKTESSREGDTWLAGVGALDASDAEDLLAAPLQVRFDFVEMGWGHDEMNRDRKSVV